MIQTTATNLNGDESEFASFDDSDEGPNQQHSASAGTLMTMKTIATRARSSSQRMTCNFCERYPVSLVGRAIVVAIATIVMIGTSLLTRSRNSKNTSNLVSYSKLAIPRHLGSQKCTNFTKPPPFPGKKGVGFTLRAKGQPGSWVENLPQVVALNPYWNYNWGLDMIAQQPHEIEFVPMLWGATKDPTQCRALLDHAVTPYIASGKVKRIMGFNEPDRADQSNIQVLSAMILWPEIARLGLPVVSPSTVNPINPWIARFMELIDIFCQRVDWLGVHWYSTPDFASFQSNMVEAHQKYKRPLVITEFAVADFNAKSPANNRYSPADVLAFAKQALPWLESQDFIAGYAWFPFSSKSPAGANSALFNGKGELTALGRYYRSVRTDNPHGDQSVRPDDHIG